MLNLPYQKMAQISGRLSRPLRGRQLTDRRAQHLFGDISRRQTQPPGLSQPGIPSGKPAVEARTEPAKKPRFPAPRIVQPVPYGPLLGALPKECRAGKDLGVESAVARYRRR